MAVGGGGGGVQLTRSPLSQRILSFVLDPAVGNNSSAFVIINLFLLDGSVGANQ